MDDFIKEIKDNLTRKNYLSALALALILPDICGKIAYPDMKHKNGRPDTGGRYAKWYDEYIYKYDNPPGLEDQENLINPLNGAAVYKLRCNFLHDGSNDIEEFLKKESTEDYSEYRFIFTDSIKLFSFKKSRKLSAESGVSFSSNNNEYKDSFSSFNFSFS